ncbi:hypothetical protein D3C71_1248090 [compost metagenome]
MQFQRLGIGRDGLIELEAAHVDVAQVEIRLRCIEPREAGQCQVEIGRVIGGHAFPVRIDEQRRRLRVVLMFEGPATLLVAGEKGIGQRVGLCRRRLQAQAHRQQ